MTFYFAWVEESDASFGAEHLVEDEDIFAFEVGHQEGEFARLTIDIRNPRVGLLGEGRERWAWLSWRKPDGQAQPLFFGRLVGLPTDMHDELVTLEFEARPPGFEAAKAALAETLKERPYWDPLFFDENALDDPDNVLQARPARWHIDRVTHAVTVSDILNGEDGTVALNGDDLFTEEDLSIAFGEPPLRRFEVEATVQWTQAAAGELNLKPTLLSAFAAAGSAANRASSYTGQGLEADWPQPDAAIGGGWRVAQSEITLLSGDLQTPEFFEAKSRESFTNYVAGPLASFAAWANSGGPNLIVQLNDAAQPGLDTPRFYLWVFGIDAFSVGYEAARQRTETLSFALTAGVQEVVTQVGDSGPSESATFRSSAVAAAIDNQETGGGELPIVDVRRRSYFDTDRGRQSVDWLLAVARARLLASARAVNISATIRFAAAADLTCRKSVTLADARLPGGTAEGKIVAYGFSANGDSGELIGAVTIACAIGAGGATVVEEGTPDYVEDGYVADGYQTRSGAGVAVVDDALAYDDFSVTPNDDGVDFFGLAPAQAVIACRVVNGKTRQEQVLAAGDGVGDIPGTGAHGFETTFADLPGAVAALNAAATRVELQLRPVTGGPFDTAVPLSAAELAVPKQIDLAASSSA